jgi:hypothetical protein
VITDPDSVMTLRALGERVLGGHLTRDRPGEDCVQSVDAEQGCPRTQRLQVPGSHSAHCQVVAAVGHPGRLGVGGRDPRLDMYLSHRGSPGVQVGRQPVVVGQS